MPDPLRQSPIHSMTPWIRHVQCRLNTSPRRVNSKVLNLIEDRHSTLHELYKSEDHFNLGELQTSKFLLPDYMQFLVLCECSLRYGLVSTLQTHKSGQTLPTSQHSTPLFHLTSPQWYPRSTTTQSIKLPHCIGGVLEFAMSISG
jgi:hypothetical protein